MSLNRRQVLQGASTAAAAGLLAAGSAWMAPAASARPAQALRPPGALSEDRFLAACLRCGLCVRDCPPQNLKLSMGGNGVAIGTPYFTAREIPCEMCEGVPCVKACPSGALDPQLTDITQARMGVAVLIDQENCLNFLGLRCDVCYRVCPVIDEAITLEKISNPRSDRHALLLPTVHADKCTGCGMCEKSCVLDEAAIKVLPERVARSAPAKHYRRGWEDGNRQGKPDFDYPVQRIPEGQHDLSPLRSGADPYPAASGSAAGSAK